MAPMAAQRESFQGRYFREIVWGPSGFERSGDEWALQIRPQPDVSLVRTRRHRVQPTGVEFRHAPLGIGRLGVSGLPHPRRGASNLSTCRMASLRRLGPLPPFPWSLVRAPLAYLLVYRIGRSFCCRPPPKTDSQRGESPRPERTTSY